MRRKNSDIITRGVAPFSWPTGIEPGGEACTNGTGTVISGGTDFISGGDSI